MKNIILLPLLILNLTCASNSTKLDAFKAFTTNKLNTTDTLIVIKLGTGTNFKFKGLAIDINSSVAYLGSWDKKEIVKIALTKNKHEILRTKYSGKLNGMGCYVKNGFVFALMNEVNENPKSQPISVLLVFDIERAELLRAYEAKGVGDRNHFNHVVVDDNGIAYISNTFKSSIYWVNTTEPGDTLKEFIKHRDLSWVHGLDLSTDGTKLFTTSYHGGIKFLDLKTRQFSSYRDITLAGDDGLKYYRGYLYGVGKNRIKRYALDETQTKVIRTEIVLENHEYFNDPRCLHIENGYLYCLANIEFKPVIFGENKKSLRSTPLADTYLIKLKLNDK